MPHALRSQAISKTLHGRLLNWGQWLRYDPDAYRLGYPSQEPFVFTPKRGRLVADLDAQYIEDLISSLAVARGYIERLDEPGKRVQLLHPSQVVAFVLKVEYGERPAALMEPPELRAKHVAGRFRMPCGRTKYYDLLKAGRLAVQFMAGPIR